VYWNAIPENEKKRNTEWRVEPPSIYQQQKKRGIECYDIAGKRVRWEESGKKGNLSWNVRKGERMGRVYREKGRQS